MNGEAVMGALELCVSFFSCVLNSITLSDREGVTFDGGFGTLNNVGIAFLMSQFCFSLFVNCESSKWLEHNS